MTAELPRRALTWLDTQPPCLLQPRIFDRKDALGVAVARELCNECPLQRPCLEHALTHHERGIWGGTNDRQRAQRRRQYKNRAA